MAVKVYLGPASAASGEITYDDADAFSVTSASCLLIQRQHSGAQKDLAVFAPNVWRHAEIVQEPRPGSKWPIGIQQVQLNTGDGRPVSPRAARSRLPDGICVHGKGSAVTARRRHTCRALRAADDGELRMAVAACLVHADAWRDADPRRQADGRHLPQGSPRRPGRGGCRGDGVRVGQVVKVGSGEPLGQALVVAAGHHLGGRGDVAGGGAQLRAAGLDRVELGCPLAGEVLVVAS
jgi:hypothetical protein